MPRVSQVYKLGRNQATLDFVDVETIGDTRLYVDPRAIERLDTDWGRWCLELLREFFERLLAQVKDGTREDALQLLSGLGEPNQTHLGQSKKDARGNGLGTKLAEDLYERLRTSKAAQTGQLQHLEDAALLIEKVSVDRVSDMATNIIREPLIEYTKQQCKLLGIPREQVGRGPVWDPSSGEWQEEEYDELPATSKGALLLVPKIIVRRRLDFDADEYYSKYILSHFAGHVLENPTTTLVRTLKSGRQKVKMKELRERVIEDYGSKKGAIIAATDADPTILDRYRKDKNRNPELKREPLEIEDFEVDPNWDGLLAAVRGLKPGADDANAYEQVMEPLLTALFYPSLVAPDPQHKITQGRKRIDIRYTVSGEGRGFIPWLSTRYGPLPFVYVECKNYTADVKNPELDQLTGRFNLIDGPRAGLLVCRRFDDKDRFLERCRDAASRQQGFVVALDDEDLTVLTEARRDGDESSVFNFLTERFGRLIE